MKKRILIIIMLLSILFIPVFNETHAIEDNILQIGDTVAVSIWGHPDLKSEVVINNEGRINLPLIGEVKAVDKSLNDLKEIITEQYKDYIKDPQINILLKEKATIQVVIMGEVYKPGSYNLRPEAKIIDLISVAGGVTEKGNLKSANLIRKENEVSVNLEGILRGDKEDVGGQVDLKDGDILYIPENIIEVSIIGEVNNPGRYKMAKGLKLRDLLARAGSITDKAAKKVRYSSDGKTETIDLVQLFSNDTKKNPTLKEGDSVYVPETTYSVSILGEVNKPGSYKWNENMRLAELIALSGNLTKKADQTKLRITHQDGSVDFVNIKKFYEENMRKENPTLKTGDIVMVPETDKATTVTILGEIKNPGTYEWHENMRLAELLARAGSLQERGNAQDVKIIHNDGKYETIDFKKYLDEKEESLNPQLKAGDVVVINEVDSPNWSQIFSFVSGFNAIKTLLEISW